ncbi:Flagellar attachment zone protein 1 [Lasiodiplodia theobromae]|uniref:Flagellar attachment zone protein 1 n=1 Tax=Lasiodiplodia theobromae TaxID=45133 RepID=A0A5N5D587_9PEZI|nr:Flagellar attachment zone protein 1 [Lasiodiplodia theobromae]
MSAFAYLDEAREEGVIKVKSANASLGRANEELQRKYAAATDETAMLLAELKLDLDNRKWHELRKLQEGIDDAWRDIESLAATLARSEQSLEDRTGALNAARDDVHRLSEELEDMQRDNERLAAELHDAHRLHTATRHRLQAKSAENEQLNRELADSNNRCTHTTNELQQTSARLDDALGDNRLLAAGLAAAEASVRDAAARLQAASAARFAADAAHARLALQLRDAEAAARHANARLRRRHDEAAALGEARATAASCLVPATTVRCESLALKAAFRWMRLVHARSEERRRAAVACLTPGGARHRP